MAGGTFIEDIESCKSGAGDTTEVSETSIIQWMIMKRLGRLKQIKPEWPIVLKAFLYTVSRYPSEWF